MEDTEVKEVSIKVYDHDGRHPDWIRAARRSGKKTLGKLTEYLLNKYVAECDRTNNQSTATSTSQHN